MILGRDIRSRRLLLLKGGLFLLLGLIAGGLILAESLRWRTALLLGITVWAFCRFYYFLFYVLERYAGRKQPFAGVLDALGYLLRGKRD